jgi:hypothetical protein
MIIKFKIDDYYETCDEYERVFELDDTVDVVDEENCLIVSTKRIVVPELHASFRTAEWYARNEEVEDEYDEDALEIQSSVFVYYPENERNPEKYISFATCELADYVSELYKEKVDYEVIAQLECYIDTEEFIDEETLKSVLDD